MIVNKDFLKTPLHLNVPATKQVYPNELINDNPNNKNDFLIKSFHSNRNQQIPTALDTNREEEYYEVENTNTRGKL